MTNRTLLGLLAALGVLVVLVLVGQRAETPQRSLAGERLLPELQGWVDDVERVSVVKAGNEPVATMERGTDGWRMLERDGYPADFGKIRETLLALAEARIVEQTTANPELYHRLGVEDLDTDAAGGLAVTLHSGAEALTVIVGDAAARGQRYVRPVGSQQSYLIDRDPSPPRQTAEWLDPSIVNLAANRVASVTITHPDGQVVRIRKEEPAQANFTVEDVPEGRELQFPGVANVTGTALRELRLEDVERVGREEGDAEEAATAEYRTFDGLVVTVTGIRRGDEAWVSLAADVAEEEETGAAAGGSDAGADGDVDGNGDVDAESEADAEADGDVAEDVSAEARAINERVAGWRYRVPAYQYEQMTRRMEDLLRARTDD